MRNIKKLLKRAGIVVGMSIVAIELHEMGHLLAYRLMGYSATMSLQRVMPVPDVPTGVDQIAKLAGPVASFIAAAVFYVWARQRSNFALTTAAFTNATLRLFPLIMDIRRAIDLSTPFSDEGEVALALAHSAGGRIAVLLVFVALSLVLALAAARAFPFPRYRVFKVLGVYAVSLCIGISVLLTDELMGWDRPKQAEIARPGLCAPATAPATGRT